MNNKHLKTRFPSNGEKIFVYQSKLIIRSLFCYARKCARFTHEKHPKTKIISFKTMIKSGDLWKSTCETHGSHGKNLNYFFLCLCSLSIVVHLQYCFFFGFASYINFCWIGSCERSLFSFDEPIFTIAPCN